MKVLTYKLFLTVLGFNIMPSPSQAANLYIYNQNPNIHDDSEVFVQISQEGETTSTSISRKIKNSNPQTPIPFGKESSIDFLSVGVMEGENQLIEFCNDQNNETLDEKEIKQPLAEIHVIIHPDDAHSKCTVRVEKLSPTLRGSGLY
ncbi:hypothetical protein [Candidatus Odyssella acanthamoebae]|uniref:Uncharacterized protein n=1 Tax=Candidatus Odyssella acanthamoebae TaxID=91604 RepID=A0A077AUL6_9PROT|nr:hypothetical protein [Candidatus Paracaedibacter acanthamoebae]AIK96872.1 hypothetical protein ID47_09190 [Candidatus Paracaedibacter acanthamoebae]